MSERMGNGLSDRQSKFLRLMFEKRFGIEEIMRLSTHLFASLVKWMQDPKFVASWDAAIELTSRITRTENELLNLGRAQMGRAELRREVESKGGGASPEVAATSVAAAEILAIVQPTPAKPPMSERERIRTLHGEEAANAFDRLVRIRQENERALGGSLKSGESPSPCTRP